MTEERLRELEEGCVWWLEQAPEVRGQPEISPAELAELIAEIRLLQAAHAHVAIVARTLVRRAFVLGETAEHIREILDGRDGTWTTRDNSAS